MQLFENDLIEIARSIKFRKVTDPFQKQLESDVKSIKESSNLFIFADKTSNIYSMSKEIYDKILKENVTKTYHKAPSKLEDCINLEAKNISKTYDINKRAECIPKTPAFVSLKDHKVNFNSIIPCRLINPCKIELGKVMKALNLLTYGSCIAS